MFKIRVIRVASHLRKVTLPVVRKLLQEAGRKVESQCRVQEGPPSLPFWDVGEFVDKWPEAGCPRRLRVTCC